MSTGRWRGWLAAAGLLILGIALGSAGTTWLGGRMVREALQGGAETGLADRAAVRIGADLAKTLQLTPAEAARVQAILDQSAVRLKAVRAQAATQALQELRATSQRVAAELPPEKRAEYRRLFLRRFERLGFPASRLEPDKK